MARLERIHPSFKRYETFFKPTRVVRNSIISGPEFEFVAENLALISKTYLEITLITNESRFD